LVSAVNIVAEKHIVTCRSPVAIQKAFVVGPRCRDMRALTITCLIVGAFLFATLFFVATHIPMVVPEPPLNWQYRVRRGEFIWGCKKTPEVQAAPIRDRTSTSPYVKAMTKCMATRGYGFVPYTDQCPLKGVSLWPASDTADCYQANDPLLRRLETPPKHDAGTALPPAR